MISDDGQSPRPIGESWEQVKESFKQRMCIPHTGMMHRRTLFEQHGKFDESFRISGDYELLLRELKSGDTVFIPYIITAGQRLGGISDNTANFFTMQPEIMRAQRMHGQPLLNKHYLKQMKKLYVNLLLWKVFGEQLARTLLDLRRRFKGLPPHWTKP